MLTAAQLQSYDENGYLLVKGLLDRNAAASYRGECHDLVRRLATSENLDATWDSARGLDARVPETSIQHCHDVQFFSAAFSRLIVDERFTEVAAQLMGGPNVQLHHTKMFIKPPERGSPFPMHQDHPFFPHARHSMIAAIIHFDDAPEERGCVRVVPGSHRQGPLEHQESAGGNHSLPVERYPLDSAVPCPAAAGDVLFFTYLTVHGSGVNVSDAARTTLLVQMRDPEDSPIVDTHRSRGQGMMLRGINPRARPRATGQPGRRPREDQPGSAREDQRGSS